MWTWTPWLACVLIQMRGRKVHRKYVIKDTKGTLSDKDIRQRSLYVIYCERRDNDNKSLMRARRRGDGRPLIEERR